MKAQARSSIQIVWEAGSRLLGACRALSKWQWFVNSRRQRIATEGMRGVVDRCCAPRPVGPGMCVCVCVFGGI